MHAHQLFFEFDRWSVGRSAHTRLLLKSSQSPPSNLGLKGEPIAELSVGHLECRRPQEQAASRRDAPNPSFQIRSQHHGQIARAL